MIDAGVSPADTIPISEHGQPLDRFQVGLRDLLQADAVTLKDPVKLAKWAGCLALLRLLAKIVSDTANEIAARCRQSSGMHRSVCM